MSTFFGIFTKSLNVHKLGTLAIVSTSLSLSDKSFNLLSHEFDTNDLQEFDLLNFDLHILLSVSSLVHSLVLPPGLELHPDNNNNNTGLLYRAFLLLAQSALHSITPARIASLGNLTYCCHGRRSSQYPLKLGTHISPGWREAQTRLTCCPRMLSHMKQLASLGIEPTTLGL